MKIKLENIIPDPDQPRKTFDMEKIIELRGSTESLGLIQPITVRPCNGKYMIIVGERRFRAAQLDGRDELECIVREGVDDKTAREMQFAENVQQEDVLPIELGSAFIEHRGRYSMTRKQLCETGVGLSETQIARYESLHTTLLPEARRYVVDGKLDARTAYEVAKISDPVVQQKVADVVVDKDLGWGTTTKVVQLVKAAPQRSVESVVAQVQYGIEREKVNHREVLDELRRQQRQVERAAENRPSSPDCRVLLGDVSNWGAIGLVAGSVDVVITDPPYNKDFLPVFEHLSAFSAFVLRDGGSLFAMVGQSYLPAVLSMLSEKLTYHWTLAYLTPGGQSPQLWDRKVNSFWKPVLWFVKGEYKGKWLGDVVKSEVNDNDKDFHEWGQSESGMADLIRRTTEEGDLVLDPFCGGGTTGKVAVELERGFIGIDNSQESVDLTKRRLGL